MFPFPLACGRSYLRSTRFILDAASLLPSDLVALAIGKEKYAKSYNPTYNLTTQTLNPSSAVGYPSYPQRRRRQQRIPNHPQQQTGGTFAYSRARKGYSKVDTQRSTLNGFSNTR